MLVLIRYLKIVCQALDFIRDNSRSSVGENGVSLVERKRFLKKSETKSFKFTELCGLYINHFRYQVFVQVRINVSQYMNLSLGFRILHRYRQNFVRVTKLYAKLPTCTTLKHFFFSPL